MIPLTCPDCGGGLALRHRRHDGNPFLGCRAYPRCKYTSAYDQALHDLEGQNEYLLERVSDLEHELSTRPGSSVAPRRADWGLRELAVRFHPDRWPNGAIPAHDVACAINALRDRVKAA